MCCSFAASFFYSGCVCLLCAVTLPRPWKIPCNVGDLALPSHSVPPFTSSQGPELQITFELREDYG